MPPTRRHRHSPWPPRNRIRRRLPKGRPPTSSISPVYRRSNSITALTDVTAFLRKGIPPELTRAALRRAWAADPAIRDFVGLAENAWDFNDPNAMPGFGPLDCSDEQLSALIDRILGSVRSAADRVTTAVGEQTGFQPDSRIHARAASHVERPGTRR